MTNQGPGQPSGHRVSRGYHLGVDLGTTFSAAAISRDGRTEVVNLGARVPVIASVVVVREHGEILTGEAAERRAVAEPSRAAREFKRRLGDPTPLFLGGTPYGAESLTAHLLRAIVERVAEREGGRPAGLTLTHPASYSGYKLDLLRQAVRQAEVGEAQFVSEPEAAAVHYASQERLDPGQIVAVYDFGGGTFDATVLRRTEDRFEMLGAPEGMERLGGIDFDQAVMAHVDESLGGVFAELDGEDPAVQGALIRLRDDCRAAKEALSDDTDTVIPVAFPSLTTEVRLTRAELEVMIRPRVEETVQALERAVTSASLTFEQVDRILLVGGTSRIPLVRDVLRASTGRPVTADTDPKFSVALGAAQLGAIHATVTEATTAATSPPGVAAVGPLRPAEPAAPVPAPAPLRGPSSPRPRSVLGAVVVVAVLVVTGIGALLVTQRRDSSATADAPTPAVDTSSTTMASSTSEVSEASSTLAASTAPSTTSSPSADPDGPPPTLPEGTPFAAVDASVVTVGYAIQVGEAGTAPDGRAVVVATRITNTGMTTGPPEDVSLDLPGGEIAASTVPSIKGGATQDITLRFETDSPAKARGRTLAFGRTGQHRTTVALADHGAVTGPAPHRLIAAGPAVAAPLATFTVTAAQVVPWACDASSRPEKIAYEPTIDDQVTVIVTGTLTGTQAPGGTVTVKEITLSTAGGAAARSTVASATSVDGTETVHGLTYCFTVASPASGPHVLTIHLASFTGSASSASGSLALASS